MKRSRGTKADLKTAVALIFILSMAHTITHLALMFCELQDGEDDILINFALQNMQRNAIISFNHDSANADLYIARLFKIFSLLSRARERRRFLLRWMASDARVIRIIQQQEWLDADVRHHLSATVPNDVFQNCYNGHPENFKRIFRMYQWHFDEVVRGVLHSGVFSDRRIRMTGPRIIPLPHLIAAVLYRLFHGATFYECQLVFGISKSHLVQNTERILRGVLLSLGQGIGRIAYPEGKVALDTESLRWSGGNNGKFSAFQGCIAAGDGSLIPIAVRDGNFEPARWRCRKGYCATNVLGFVGFDKSFFGMWTGAEGCAHDSTVVHSFAKAMTTFPEGYYALFDAGVSLSLNSLLTPYSKTRYHLKEFAHCGRAPENAKELFNLRHSARRASAIEIAWGLLKSRFKILLHGVVAQTMDTVNLIILACAVIHNFIQRRCQSPSPSPEEQEAAAFESEQARNLYRALEEAELQNEDILGEVHIYRSAQDVSMSMGHTAQDGTQLDSDSDDDDYNELLFDMNAPPPAAVEVESVDAATWRDAISQTMWDDYQKILSSRLNSPNQLLTAEIPFSLEYLRTAYLIKTAFTPVPECYEPNTGKRFKDRKNNDTKTTK